MEGATAGAMEGAAPPAAAAARRGACRHDGGAKLFIMPA